jgi:uncharacterized protein (TIGR00730 family)
MAHRNTDGHDSAEEPGMPSKALHRIRHAICVFCGSSRGRDPAHADAARQLGGLIGRSGYKLVFGGGNVGLMGDVARAAREAGAPIVGIIPAFLRGSEPPLDSAEQLIVTPDLQERKARMLALADAFVILPGGLGTLDEFFEVVTATRLDVHAKPVIIVDVGEYFAPLRALLDQVVDHEFAGGEIVSYQEFVATPADAMDRIRILLGTRAS